jgi:hypothetical protein
MTATIQNSLAFQAGSCFGTEALHKIGILAHSPSRACDIPE